jgi:hypothetical protein
MPEEEETEEEEFITGGNRRGKRNSLSRGVGGEGGSGRGVYSESFTRAEEAGLSDPARFVTNHVQEEEEEEEELIQNHTHARRQRSPTQPGLSPRRAALALSPAARATAASSW